MIILRGWVLRCCPEYESRVLRAFLFLATDPALSSNLDYRLAFWDLLSCDNFGQLSAGLMNTEDVL